MRFSTYTTASALAALVTAQTFTDCNPMEKTCPNNPALPQTWETDFTAGKDAVKGWKQTAGSLTYGSEGADFTINKKGDAPTIGTEAYFHFGYVEVVMKAAPGVGIVSSIVLQSDDLDEVDWEWIGGVDSVVQSNHYGKGNTTTFDRMVQVDVANNQNEFHKYALNWTSESLTWIVDDKPMRTLNFADANGGKNYPQTPCNIRLGNWPGGDSENEGTRQWAGGNVTYEKGPFTMVVKSVKVVNYSPGTEYRWMDKSGDFGSIEVVGAGNAEGAPQNTVAIESSANATLAPLESGVNAPTATGEATDGDSGNPPCECGTATVTVTGAPPPVTNAPPAIFTTEFPAVPFSSLLTLLSSAAETPLASSAQIPVVTSAALPTTPTVSSPSYPTTGLEVDTRSAPDSIISSTPTGALPQLSGNSTVSAPPAQFTGAGNHLQASAFIAAIAGTLMLGL